MSSAGVRFGRTTRGGWDFDTFTRLLDRMLGLLIDQLIMMLFRCATRCKCKIQPIRNVAWAPLLSAACLSGGRDNRLPRAGVSRNHWNDADDCEVFSAVP